MAIQTKPDILYHYTTQEGLKGILSEKSLWATKIHHLNDASELNRPLDIARRILEEKEKQAGRSKIITEMITEIDVWRSLNICIASFCQNGDLLSQWRGYGVYNSAYSIGFNTKQLEESAR